MSGAFPFRASKRSMFMSQFSLEAEEKIFFDGIPSSIYHFAYGINMNKSIIAERCNDARILAVAKLPGYRLVFSDYSRVWDGGMEGVIREPGHDLWGLIYELNQMDRNRLDIMQDVRMDGTGTYFHYPARIVCEDGLSRIVLFYKKNIQGELACPSTELLNLIIGGAEEHSLPASYIEELKNIPSKKASCEVPRRRNFGREFLIDGLCSECGG